MNISLLAIYIFYIALGMSLKSAKVRIFINSFKIFSEELYDFLSRVFIFLGASGLITYVILTYNN